METATIKLRQPVWDSILIPDTVVSAGTRYSFYQIPKGQSNGTHTKSKVDTNLTVAGQMPYNAMEVRGLKMLINTRTVTPCSPKDVNHILYSSTIEMKKEDNLILEAPTYMLPAGAGIEGFAATTDTTTTLAVANNGATHGSNCFKFDVPQIFTIRERLQLDLIIDSAIDLGSALYVTAILDAVVIKVQR